MSNNNFSAYPQLRSDHEEQTEARVYCRRPGKRRDNDEKLQLSRDPKKPKRNNGQKLKRLRYERRMLNRAARLAEVRFEAQERADIAREVRLELEQERQEENDYFYDQDWDCYSLYDYDFLSDEQLEDELLLELCGVTTEGQALFLQLKGKDFEVALENYYNSQFWCEPSSMAA